MHPDPALWTVVVTGGSSGLGAAVAARLAATGATPVVLDVRPPAPGLAYEQVDLADSKDARRRCAAPPRTGAAWTPS